MAERIEEMQTKSVPDSFGIIGEIFEHRIIE